MSDEEDDPMTLAFVEWAEEAEGTPTLREAFEAGWSAALDALDEEDE